ncbi:MAG: DNA ligase D [Proteobacteria bacterium]|nr:DNA ligase D [Pseudomonadota bacterium]
MKLATYHQKRKFQHTPEPKGKVKKSSTDHLFVVQKHDAKHLHYDFRLEINGVLKSWAVPKGPCLDPKVKRLAVQVEDHPIEYGDFEGVIPQGHYGGGTVMIWDKGTWHEIQDDTKDKKKGAFSFELHGEKLKGYWKLIQIKDDPKNWLLIKGKDEQAIAQEAYDVLQADKSVLSGRTMNEIAENKALAKKTKIKSDALNIKKSKLPQTIKPQLATLVDKAPVGDEWLHEMKYDGYRLISKINKNITLLTRNGHDWTNKFENIANEVAKLKLKDTILDGEVVVLDNKGKPNFQLMQNVLKEKLAFPMVYYVFDIIFYQGKNVSSLTLLERKKILENIIPKKGGVIRFSEHIQGDGQSVYDNACALGFEGIISKNIHSRYVQKRTKSWLKVKCTHRQEFVVGGFTKSQENRGVGALLLGYYQDNKLHYCGKVGTGFSSVTLRQLHLVLKDKITQKSPFVDGPKGKEIVWIKPSLVVEIEFTEWTQEGLLRHPSFKGIREDKKAREISQEKSLLEKEIPYEITHPTRIVYPEENITKLEVAAFYYDIQEWILPHITARPLAVVRCPQGLNGACFFQKHIVNSKKIKHIYESDKFLYIEDIDGLIQLLQLGVLEFHTNGARIDNLAKPDMVTFDLDPGKDVSWKKVVDTAFLIKKELENYNLQSFVKATGGNGLHVVVPIARRYNWATIGSFAKTFAHYLAAKYPKDYINVMTKYKRQGKIYIDYLRNQPKATAICPYSTRARENASIAIPLRWEELSRDIKSADYTMAKVENRMRNLTQDPWQGFFAIKQKLPKC